MSTKPASQHGPHREREEGVNADRASRRGVEERASGARLGDHGSSWTQRGYASLTARPHASTD